MQRSLEYAKEVRKQIEEIGIVHEKNSASEYVTASMGLVVQKGEFIGDRDTIYRMADEGLYHSKEQGRNRVTLAGSSDS